MSTATRIQPTTFDEFCFLVRDGQKADLIDGVIYMASPDNLDANNVNGWLFRLLGEYVENKDLGRLFVSRVAIRLDKINAPEPDIVFVRKGGKDKLKRGFIAGAVDIAIEIVSPDSVDRDYVEKRALYERFGIREYWIIDETNRSTTFLRLSSSKKYREVRLRRGEFHSLAMNGFWFRPEWLWHEPLPPIREVIRTILGRQP